MMNGEIKMEKEFNLKEKRVGFQEIQDKAHLLLKVEDVKEFLRLLIEKFGKHHEYYVKDFIEGIDKLSGGL